MLLELKRLVPIVFLFVFVMTPSVFANTATDLNPDEVYSSYDGYKFLYSAGYVLPETLHITNERVETQVYAVAKGDKHAVFAADLQVTDFLFDSIELDGSNVGNRLKVSWTEAGREQFGIIEADKLGNELYGNRTRPVKDIYANSNIECVVVPLSFKSIEVVSLNSELFYKAVDFEENTVYITDNKNFPNAKYNEEFGYYFLSEEDFRSADNPDKDYYFEVLDSIQKIEGIEGVYKGVEAGGSVVLFNEEGSAIGVGTANWAVTASIGEADDEAYCGKLIHILYSENIFRVSYADAYVDENLNIIAYDPDAKANRSTVYKMGDEIIICLVGDYSGSDVEKFYDIEGNAVEVDKSALVRVKKDSEDYSAWAESDILAAIQLGILPGELRCNYTENITRGDFCKALMYVYDKITYTYQGHSEGWFNGSYSQPKETPFTDCDDIYITRAYALGVVSGKSENEFKPDDPLTRQEAAVMLCRFLKVMDVEPNLARKSFSDSSYFADWAREAIYYVTSVSGEDKTAVMTGTTDEKFSPWMNYTREQAYVTLYRTLNIWRERNNK